MRKTKRSIARRVRLLAADADELRELSGERCAHTTACHHPSMHEAKVQRAHV